MSTLQQYLQNLADKEQIKEIDIEKINQTRGNDIELLEGGELDLREFINLEELKISNKFLKTSLLKIEVNDLTKLKELNWIGEVIEESEENKNLWEELGISNDNNKKKIVREIKRLSELRKVNVYFSTAKSKKEQLKEELSFVDIKEVGSNVYLDLDNTKDKRGNFSSILVLWNFVRELTKIKLNKNVSETWNYFWDEDLEWTKKNVSQSYKAELESLSNLSIFPNDLFDVAKIYQVPYFLAKPSIDLHREEFFNIAKEKIADKIWKECRRQISEAIKNSSSSENLMIELLIKDKEKEFYDISIACYGERDKYSKIIRKFDRIPLEVEKQFLEEEIKKTQNAVAFMKLQKQNQLLLDSLLDNTDDDTYRKIKEKIAKIY